MGLRDYFKKRSFDKTPEPKGTKSSKSTTSHAADTKGAKKHKLKFVVQEHHATALHYDFRLEMDGVLKSWAVPKGPSMNPHDHHLALQTEDHPYEYRNFEGVIPEDNYGAGNVIIWDEGWYESRTENGTEQTLLRDLKKGHVTFILHGDKLQGEFALIKMPKAQDQKAWLLIKKGDQYASEKDITQQDESVRSHHKVDDLGAHNKLPDLKKFPKVTKPWTVKPMLCTPVDEPFDREDWLFEVKWDGYRAIASKHKDDLQLYSRNNLNFADRYPPITEALRELQHDVILDGEIVVVDDHGGPHFEWLQGWVKAPDGHLQYHVFDILWCAGYDVRSMPLRQRKALLKAILPTKSETLLYSDDVESTGIKLFHEMQHQNLEGMVAKNASSEYKENIRGNDWLKVKTHMRQEVVIGGYTEPRGGRKYLGSLLVGTYEKGDFVYRGHSGGGIPDDQRQILQAKLAKIERHSSPFLHEPKPNAPVHWVRPILVCEMEFSEWTSEGYMRHPEFKGLRPDKDPKDVKREKIKHTPAAGATTSQATVQRIKGLPKDLPFEITHPDKIFFPKQKYTKGDLFSYYAEMAVFILPYLKDRPLSMNRMPNGIKGPSFFQKNNEHLPGWVPSTDIFSESNNENLHWIVGGDLNTLLYLVQLGSVEINPWNSRVAQLNKPDWLVIDLDPEGVTFKDVINVAITVHEVCEAWHIPTYPKTSGKTGIHIFVPLGTKYDYEQCKNLAHLIVLEVNKHQPKITSVERNPQKRKHRIYLDFLQNREGQTLAAPYSVRPTEAASVSTPLHWDEVKPGLDPLEFTIKNTAKRLNRVGDLWKPVVGKGIDIGAILKKIDHNPEDPKK
jgi:bifunctional non-homologous end joining protein LigD